MSFGNHTYQEDGKASLVFLAKSDCAILDVSQTFNTKDKTFYNGEPTITLKSCSIKKNNSEQATIVEGVLVSSVHATYLYIGHNGHPVSGGYDNITFITEVSPTSNTNEYSFSLKMPYNDVFNNYEAKDILELSVVVITENGYTKNVLKYNYTIGSLLPEPNDDIEKEVP